MSRLNPYICAPVQKITSVYLEPITRPKLEEAINVYHGDLLPVISSKFKAIICPVYTKNNVPMMPVKSIHDLKKPNHDDRSRQPPEPVSQTKLNASLKPESNPVIQQIPQEASDTENEIDLSILTSKEHNPSDNYQYVPTYNTVDDLFYILYKPAVKPMPKSLLPPPPPQPISPTFSIYKQSPTYKNGLQLRDYQIESLNWMIDKWRHHQGGILADEMGLGKTIQV